MKFENTYLSDEELEQLILNVEQNELVAAPPDLLDEILAGVEVQQGDLKQMMGTQQEPVQEAIRQNRCSENKGKEFRRYCFRVVTSAAAAIALVFFAPNMENAPKLEVPSRQEVEETSLTREEVLDDSGILTQIFGGSKLFDKEFNLFNGG